MHLFFSLHIFTMFVQWEQASLWIHTSYIFLTKHLYRRLFTILHALHKDGVKNLIEFIQASHVLPFIEPSSPFSYSFSLFRSRSRIPIIAASSRPGSPLLHDSVRKTSFTFTQPESSVMINLCFCKCGALHGATFSIFSNGKSVTYICDNPRRFRVMHQCINLSLRSDNDNLFSITNIFG